MPLVTPFKRVACPYCFERFQPVQTLRRDISPGAPIADDHHIQKFFGLPSPPRLGEVHPVPVGKSFWHRLWRRVFVPREGDQERMICPNCHIFLPDLIARGEAAREVIAIVGARNSGKSNYFGVLIQYLRRQYSSNIGFDMLDTDTYGPGGRIPTANLYQERYGDYLFDLTNPRVVPQTQRAGQRMQRDDPRIPLIYLLRFRKRPWHYISRPLAHRIPVYLTIFDAAGEDMTDQAAMEQYYRFILSATGIIFLIDPFDYPGVRARLPDPIKTRLPKPMSEPSLVVDNVLNLFRGRGRYRGAEQIPIPVAFTLTKSDLFAHASGLLYSGAAMSREGAHVGGFDRVGCEAMSMEVTQYITEWDSPELVHKAKSNFSRHSFFAVSALGQLPRQANALDGAITPRRVADPLLWLLWMRGYIPEAQP